MLFSGIETVVIYLLCTKISHIHAARNVYMDSPTACGQTFSVGNEEVLVRPRGDVGSSNPPTSCIVYFESSYTSSKYKFEIVVLAANFRGCALELRIFDGLGVGGKWIRNFGCGSSDISTSTGHFYSEDRAITLHLSRTADEYQVGSDFQIRLTVYSVDGAEEFVGTSNFPVGAIVGIVLGLIVIIAFAVMLGWCYKTGRLTGLSGADNYPSSAYKTSANNLSVNQYGGEGQGGGGGNDNGSCKTWHNTDTKSNMSDTRSNFDLDDARVWDSLTNTTGTHKNSPKILNVNNPGHRPPVNQGRFVKNSEFQRNTADPLGNFKREEPAQMSSSPRSRSKVQGHNNNEMSGPPRQSRWAKRDQENSSNRNGDFDRGELGLRGSGRDMRDKKRDSLLDEIKKKKSSGLFENPDQEGYLYDYDQVKKLSGEEINEPKVSTFENELKNAIRKNSMKRQKSETTIDQTSPSETSGEYIINEDKIPSKDHDGETTGPEAQSSPKPKKKKRKKEKEHKSPKSSRKQRNTDENGVPKSPKSKSRHKTTDEEKDLPPEVYAPIFTTDESNNPADEYHPNQYQPGYQPSYPAAPYDPRYPGGPYPPGPPGMPAFYPGAPPYQQAGQAQWFVENAPNGQQKMAFAMTTHSQSEDSLQGGHPPGGPSYTSTPYHPNQYGAAPGGPGMNNSLVPAGTILDDPQVPPPGTSLVRYDDDPYTGIKTSQVIWTDSKPDPTDPPPGESNPQITRKTITRITTKTTQDDMPDAPNPSLKDMSFRTAQQIQASGQEPAFMSPTRGAQHYPHSAIQYAASTPERSNAPYYSNTGGHHIPGSPSPVIHEAPRGNHAIRDRIALNLQADV